MSDSATWAPRPRACAAEREVRTLDTHETSEHPFDERGMAWARQKAAERAAALAPPPEAAAPPAPLRPVAAPVDPLGIGGGGAGGGGAGGGEGEGSAPMVDPLGIGGADAPGVGSATISSGSRSAVGGSGASGGHQAGADDGRSGNPHLNWTRLRSQVLGRYTVSGKVSLPGTLLEDAAKMDIAEERARALEEARARIADMERGAGAKTVNMTQRELQGQLHREHERLRAAWARGERVVAFKIAIKVAKLLSRPLQTGVPQFYPSMFMLVSALLDTFGRLVFERIRDKADSEHRRLSGGKLPEDFTAADVGAEAREMCSNWLYKMACIRELIGRLYLELALLECYRFLTDVDFASVLQRLSHACRGLGDPLAANFARLYLAKAAARLVAGERERDAVRVCLRDALVTFKDMESSPTRLTVLERIGVPPLQYLDLHAPAIGWLIHQVGWRAPRKIFTAVLRAYRDRCGSSMVLKPILEAFDGSYTTPFLKDVIGLIRSSRDSMTPKSELYRCLAAGLIPHPPATEVRLPFLNEGWGYCTKHADEEGGPELFANCAATFIELATKHYSPREVLILLKDLARRMLQAARDESKEGGGEEGGEAGGEDGKRVVLRVPEACGGHLERALVLVVAAGGLRERTAEEEESGVEEQRAWEEGAAAQLVTSDAFVRLLDLFHGERKDAVCKRMLQAAAAKGGAIHDPVLAHTLLDVARQLHDSLDYLSPPEERARVGELIAKLIARIDYGRDLERHLEMLSDARRSFRELDAPRQAVCASAIALTRRALLLVRGRHSKRTQAFLKTALSFIHISIPAIDRPDTRVRFFLDAASAALANNCDAQADGMVLTAAKELEAIAEAGAREGRSDWEVLALDCARQILGFAILAPGHPEKGPFHLIRSVLLNVERGEWEVTQGNSTRVYLAAYSAVAALTQTPLPYHVPGAPANDTLYEGDPAYEEESQALADEIISKVLSHLSDLDAVAKAQEEAGSAATSDARSSQRSLLIETVEVLAAHAAIHRPQTAELFLKIFRKAVQIGAYGLPTPGAAPAPSVEPPRALERLKAIPSLFSSRGEDAATILKDRASPAELAAAAARIGIASLGEERRNEAKAIKRVLVALAGHLETAMEKK